MRRLSERVFSREWLACWGSLLLLILFQLSFTGWALLQSTRAHFTVDTVKIEEGKPHTYYHSEDAEILTQLVGMMAVLVLVELVLFLLFTRRGLVSPPVLVPLFILLTISVVYQSYVNSPGTALKHFIFVLMGVLMMLGAMGYAKFSSRLNLSGRALEIIAVAALVVCLICSVYGLLHPVNGSGSWVRIGGFSIQPGEFFKVYVLAYIGPAFARLKSSPGMFWVFLVTSGVICVALILVNDLGNAIIMAALLLIVIYVLAGWRWFAAALASGGGLAAVGILVLNRVAPNSHVMLRLKETTWSALTVPGSNGNLRRALLAMVRGGILGTGLGDSYYATANYAANCDFCYSAMISIFGAGLGLLVAGCFVALILSGRMRLDQSGQNLVLFHYSNIVLAVLAVQALVHIGGNLNVLPFTGVVLPFMSIGGSNMLSSFLCVGIAMGGKLPNKKIEKRWRGFRGRRKMNEEVQDADNPGVYASGAAEFSCAAGAGCGDRHGSLVYPGQNRL